MTVTEKKRKKIIPLIPWLGFPARGGSFWSRIPALLESPVSLIATTAIVGASAGVIIAFGPAVVDRISGESAGGARPGLWSSWYDRGWDNKSAVARGRTDSVGYLRGTTGMGAAGTGTAGGGVGPAGAAEKAEEAAADEAAPPEKTGEEEEEEGSKEGTEEEGDGEEKGPVLAGGRFGRLTSSMGGGGMASMGGGVPKRFSGRSGAGAAAPTSKRRFKSAGTRRMLSTRGRGGKRGPGTSGALGQLKRAAKISNAGRSMQPEAASTTEAAAFEMGGGAGMPTGGEGLSTGGVGSGVPDSPPSSNNSNEDFQEDIAPDVGDSRNQTPYQNYITMGRLLILLTDLLLFVAAFAKQKGLIKMAKLAAAIAVLLAMVVVGMGFAISQKYGQAPQGQILMAAGGVASALAGYSLATGKSQTFLFVLAGVTSGIIIAIGLSLTSNL